MQAAITQAVAQEARSGLLAHPRTLSPWLFYDERGSALFEEITALPEYYLTRTERSIFSAHAEEILEVAAAGDTLTLLELGAGTATKTGILLAAAVDRQGSVLYQPVDVSSSALDEATANIQAHIPGVTVRPQVANYTAEPLTLSRPHNARVLALYIGSSIGNFSPSEATALLANLRTQLRLGDSLLIGADLVPGPHKSVATTVVAYDDAAGITAAFNRNILDRLNRDLDSNFDPSCFHHRARWNANHSRMEMHLDPITPHTVHIPANSAGPALHLNFRPGETIHTENSYKFTPESLTALLQPAGFQTTRTWLDPQELFAVTLASAS
ncbi:MAG: L-histidine N(alpha)-methyltransferase [Acidobacteriaceae bacterium]